MLQKLASRAGVDNIWPDPADRRAATMQLLEQAAAKTGPERREIEDLVVELNLQFAKDVARRYRGRGIDLDDLEQVACMGLVKAVQRFEADKGREFLSFAVPTIRGELRRHFRDRAWMVRPPRSIQEMQAAISGAEEALVQSLGRSPRPREIAEHLDADLDLVLEALGATGCYVPSSLDAPLSPGESSELGQMLGTEEDGFETAEARAQLGPVLAGLTERERTIIELRFGQNRTQAEIGASIGVTQMQVSRLLTATLAKMRSALEPTAAA